MNIKGVRNYLADALQAFVADPADTEYQRGYQDALTELARVVEAVWGPWQIVRVDPRRPSPFRLGYRI